MANQTKTQKACASIAENCSSENFINTCTAGVRNSFSSSATASVMSMDRESYSKDNYLNSRPGERAPVGFLQTVIFSNNAYYNFTIVRTMIDLMTDFCAKGLQWSHPNRTVQNFYKQHYQKVDGDNVSERFCNYLIRHANVAILPEISKIDPKTASNWKRSRAEFSEIKNPDNLQIPSAYHFLDVTALYPVINSYDSYNYNIYGGHLSSRNGAWNYRIQTPLMEFSNDKKYTGVPKYLIDRFKTSGTGGQAVLKKDEDFLLYHYRRDDWEMWATPLVATMSEQLIMLDKLHLADASALDGAISGVRLWNLGFIDQTNSINSQIPSFDALRKVANYIKRSVKGGQLDVVWGPDLKFTESSSNAYKFLLPEKYIQVMSEIYSGFGINPGVSGGSSSSNGQSGFGNNAISIKVLVERLNYIRGRLINFWTKESERIQKAMGFAYPAKVIFEDPIFSDEINYKRLLIELSDRNVISHESLRNEFNLIDKIENSRIRSETRQRKNGRSPRRSSPYHDPMVEDKLASDLIKSGNLDGDEMNIEVSKEDVYSKDKGGRPVGVKDSSKRKPKEVSPKTSVANVDTFSLELWAKDSLEEISEIIGPVYLKSIGKKNFRQLTTEEGENFEIAKLAILKSIPAYSKITAELISENSENISSIEQEIEQYNKIIENISEKINRPISVYDKRSAAASAYASCKTRIF